MVRRWGWRLERASRGGRSARGLGPGPLDDATPYPTTPILNIKFAYNANSPVAIVSATSLPRDAS